MLDAAVACRDVTYTYLKGTPLEATALRGVSFEIQSGECVAIIGPTGSGKSTLIQHFNGLLRPTSGTVWVAGQDLWAPGADRRRARQQVGLLFQFPEYQLFEETVRADVAYGPKNLGLQDDAISARVEEALRAVGLDPARFGERSPFGLSGGEMRRVAMAGVLAMRPRVLVLDEPTAGLDPRGRADLLERVEALHAEGLTIVLATHSMDEAAQLADRIIVLHDGRVVMEGGARAVFGHAEDLQRIGLAVPQAARLIQAIRARGLAVADALTIEQARTTITAALRGARHGAH